MMMTRTSKLANCALLLAASAFPAYAQELPPVAREDFGKWESLGVGTLSPDGTWLAVPISRVNGRNELRLHRTDRDSVIVVPYGARAAFSEDGRWVAYAIGKSEEEREKIEEDAGEGERANEREEEPNYHECTTKEPRRPQI